MNQPEGIEPFLEPLESLQRLLSRFNERGVIIGGAAVSILGKARYTEDIDAMFLLSIKDIPQLLKEASEEGIEPRIDNAAEFARKNRVALLKHVISNTNIDLSLASCRLSKRWLSAVSFIKLMQRYNCACPHPKT
jgi:hypothetical protein